MKAIVCKRYGDSHSLSLQDIAKPDIQSDTDCIVRVKASTVNDWDWVLMRGKPRLYRLLFGLFRPRWPVLGSELAGVVESVGAQVTDLNVGDAVYGDVSEAGFGGFAEYARVPAAVLRPIPEGLSFEQAVMLPHAAGLAWQALVETGQLNHGESVLINGVGGGVGVLGVQIARHQFGCAVSGVDKQAKLDALHWLGLAETLDYQSVDFTATGQRYDVILDVQTTRSTFQILRALKRGGRYVTVGGPPLRLMRLALIGAIVGRLTKRRISMLVLKPNRGLAEVEALALAGQVQPLLDQSYPLEELPAAVERFGRSEHVGKIVVTVGAKEP